MNKFKNLNIRKKNVCEKESIKKLWNYLNVAMKVTHSEYSKKYDKIQNPNKNKNKDNKEKGNKNQIKTYNDNSTTKDSIIKSKAAFKPPKPGLPMSSHTNTNKDT